MPEDLLSTSAAGVVVGVDTHKDVHVAVAVDAIGRRLGQHAAGTDPAGLNDLLRWAHQLDPSCRWGIEGTSSYGAGLSRALQATGATVHEVCRPNRRMRRTRGKSDPIDAEAAARAVLAGQDLVDPKSVVAVSESLRQLRATRRSAVKARTQAANLIHALLLTAPADLREHLNHDQFAGTVHACARLRPGSCTSPREACKTSLRSAARRWEHLDTEDAELTEQITDLVAHEAPELLNVFGVGPDVAAALLITVGGNPDRMRTEASFAALCGISPIPASSGKTHRHRLNRGGDRQANAAIHVVALTRRRSDARTKAYLEKRTAQGLSPRDINRCLKRYIARELYRILKAHSTP